MSVSSTASIPAAVHRMHERVLASMREGVNVSDERGVIVWTNDAEDAMFGYQPGELAGRHVGVLNAYPPEENERIVAAVIAQLRRTGEWRGEWSNVRKDGTPFSTYARITALEMDGSRYWVCVHEDITERRRAGERTAALQRLSAALGEALAPGEVARISVEEGVEALGASSGILVLLDDDGRTLRLVAAKGFAREVVERWGSFPIDTPVPIAAAVREARPAVLESLAAYERVHPMLGPLAVTSPDPAVAAVPLLLEGKAIGALGLSYARARPFTAEEVAFMQAIAGQCAIAVGRGRLYAEERAAREEAERASSRIAFLAAASATLAASLDVDSTLAAVARLAVPELADWCFVEMLDETREQLHMRALHHSDPELVALAWRTMARWPLRMDSTFGSAVVARTGRSSLVPEIPPGAIEAVAHDAEHLAVYQRVSFRSMVQAPLRARRPDGGEEVVGVLSFATSGGGGRRFGEEDLALAEEVATRAGIALENARLFQSERAARAEAEAASRAKSEFLAVMSHELRTPLNAIGGYAELLEMGIRGPVTEAQREDLARIQRSQKHLLGLINEVLNYARVETGAVRYELADVGVAETLVSVETLIAPQMRAKGLVYRSEVCGSDVAVRADRDKLQQILVNLLSNAVKFTEPGGRIEVQCEPHGDRVATHVRDTGVGIAADKLESVFEPFVQVDARLTRTQEGVGLGLAISRDLARGMGGDLTAESTPGAGSTFTLVLPAARA